MFKSGLAEYTGILIILSVINMIMIMMIMKKMITIYYCLLIKAKDGEAPLRGHEKKKKKKIGVTRVNSYMTNIMEVATYSK